MDDLPVEPKEVVGLEDIIANTGKTLDQLVEDKQVDWVGRGGIQREGGKVSMICHVTYPRVAIAHLWSMGGEVLSRAALD